MATSAAIGSAAVVFDETVSKTVEQAELASRKTIIDPG
eukprot:CAMPEP_0171618520 /NCGR_PEP_ID=MMETSP0990-20121206/14800_1 /TAXON_ID=483369 /ORGANISM="non described non described, Strain CCMP2098" /LENGTH=37 /DNA_ID= /DNA_START= /DNA_END= /DNA_ORIENTATION=